MLNATLAIVFPTLMAFSAAYDLLTMRIPNWISVALVVGFALCAFFVGMPILDVGYHVAVGIGVLVVAFLLFIPGWIGGGDAKLAAAIGLWMGTGSAIIYLAYAALFGGVLTFAILLFRWKYPVQWIPKWNWLLRLHDKTVGVPYGIALAAGAMVVYADTPIFAALLGVS